MDSLWASGGNAATGWLLHHDYNGAISNLTRVKGLRLRSGNVQVGDHALLENLFPEPRFNSWAVGEIHILYPKILANGRRDNFEHSVHLDNILNQLAPIARDVAHRCRQSSISRKWQREFDFHKEAALERAKMVARGGLTRAAKQIHVDAALKSLKAMKKVLENRYLDEEVRKSLTSKANTTEASVERFIGDGAIASNPLATASSPRKAAYEHIISLIYECSANRVAAGALVGRLLNRLSDEANKKAKPKAAESRIKSAIRKKPRGKK